MWVLLSLVRSLVLGTDPTEEPPVSQLAGFLRTHLRRLDAMYSRSNLQTTKAAIVELSEERYRCSLLRSLERAPGQARAQVRCKFREGRQWLLALVTPPAADNAYNSAAGEFKFLVKECGFHVVDYGNKHVELVCGNLRISFLQDRYYEGPSTILVASVHDEPEEGTRYVYALGTVRKFVLNSYTLDCATTSELADFLRVQITTVQSMFSKENLKETGAALDRLGRELAEKTWPGAYLD